jgi:hypothetical protein
MEEITYFYYRDYIPRPRAKGINCDLKPIRPTFFHLVLQKLSRTMKNIYRRTFQTYLPFEEILKKLHHIL